MLAFVKRTFVIAALTLLTAAPAFALSGTVNFVVLRVAFSDFPNGTRFTTTETKQNFTNIATLWGTHTSYGKIKLNYQFAGPVTMPHPSTTYIDVGGTSTSPANSSSNAAMQKLLGDAIASAPNTIDWTNIYGVVIVFMDNRANGFYRGITWPGQSSISPPSGSQNVYFSIVGEDTAEDATTAWGRWAHEMGHEMQANPGNPWHPSNYNSNFEQMDGEYPAQSGVFNKQANIAYPGWLPPSKYKITQPPNGTAISLYAEEQRPGTEPDYQAIKAYLNFGGTKVYYLVSVRHRILGDDLNTGQTPNGIPDEGVLIERVVEGGDPTIDDCAPNPGGCYRWVNVIGNGNPNTLWHAGDTYANPTDGIYIGVASKEDADHYEVAIYYTNNTNKPDVGMQSWLSPPNNTYETTDIWVDSPVNGYGTYRYPNISDLLGGTVPSGNGDDPAVGLTNRLYARVRNYGGQPATNVVVHFDITNPPGLGINGPNAFQQLGTVTSSDFPGLASIPPGGHVDVYLNWTPKFNLTPAQIKAGIFYFHTCVRVRIDHVAGETFFGNQDGDGQQENIMYFQAGSASTPGAPGPSNKSVIHLHNDSNTLTQEFALSVLRESIPDSWNIKINGGNPNVKLGPGDMVDVPVEVKQTETEAVGSVHTFRVYAASQVTLTSPASAKPHNDMHLLGGVQVQATVLRKSTLECKSAGKGRVVGKLTGPTKFGNGIMVSAVGVNKQGFQPNLMATAQVDNQKGTFSLQFSPFIPFPTEAVCLFQGTTTESSAGSKIFPM